MKNFILKIHHVWYTNRLFIILLVLLNMTTGAINNINHEIGLSIYTKLIHGFINTFLIAYLIAWVKDLFKNLLWRNCIKTISILISILLCGVEIFLLSNFNTVINPSMILILLETNSQEAIEFIQTYDNVKWITLGALLFTLGASYLTKHLPEKLECPRNSQLGSSRWILIFILLAGLGAGGYRFIKEANISNDIISPHMKTMLPIQRLYYSYLITQHDLQQYEAIAQQLGSTQVKILSNQSHIQNVVLILGESLGRNHMSLYGYPLPTTPQLDSLHRQGELVKFTNVICSSLYTSQSIQRIMSFFNNESDQKWYHYNNLIDVMKASGYKTFWISNQEMIGVYGNYVASIGRRCDDVYFNNKRNSIDERYGDFDGDLIPILKEKLQDNSEKKFIVLHFMGSHPLYRNRYPDSFNHFKADDEPIPYDQSAKEMTAQYDNTVLYNDYVMNEIIQTLKKKEAILIYLSDHGNEVYDYRNYTGRSEDDISRYMVEIPLLIWKSARFQTRYPDKSASIANAVDKPYMTDDLIHTILDITDIHVEEYDSTRSIINTSFNENRQRIISDYNYDAKP